MIKRSLLLVSVVLLAWPATAWAHPAYKASDPPANSSVSQAPSELWVEFTERIEDGTVSVYDPCGVQVDNGDSQQNLTNDRITVTMDADKAGTYRVVWKVLGSDSHPTNGEFNFTSSGGASCPSEEEEDPDDDPNPDNDPKPRDGSADEDGNDTSGAVGPKSGGRTDRHPDGHKERQKNESENDRANAERASTDLPDEELDIATPAAAKSIWDGLPLSDFAIALGVAALIGAAGGRIYAGIVGPR